MSELRFENVTVRYGTSRHAHVAVDTVDLVVPSGQVVGLVGESGSGKSTLARAAVGLIAPAAGKILLGGKPVPRRGRRPLQMVFQDPYGSLDPRMSTGELIAEAIGGDAVTGRSARSDEAVRLAELVGLPTGTVDRFPRELSGGQRQRVALARALAGRPDVIIADEITSALDVSTQGAVLNLVRELQRELGFSMLFISHNLAVVRYVADYVAVMYQGRIVEYGPAERVLLKPEQPYTRQLLAAVPRPGTRIDVATDEGDEERAATVTALARSPHPPPTQPQPDTWSNPVIRRQRVEDLSTFAVPEQPALSPDGRTVVYVLTTVDAAADTNVRSLWRATTAPDGRARQLTRGKADFAPAWSPDATEIAFLRADAQAAQVWVLPAEGGEPEQVTTLPLGAGAPVWSPDGMKIAFGAPVDLRAADGEEAASGAKRAAGPVVTRRLDHKADGVGLLGPVRTHLHVLDLATRRVKQVTEGDWHASDPVWSPDSARLGFAAATAPDADVRLRAPVYSVDVSGRFAKPELVALADGIGTPTAWSADGSALIVVGTPNVPSGHQRLLRVPLDADGTLTDLAPSLDRNVMPGGSPTLTDDGATVVFCVRDRGCTHVYATATDGTGTPRPVVTGAGRVVSGLSVSPGAGPGGTAAVALATPDSYGEIVVVDLASGAETVITTHGAGQEDVELYARQEREFTISDGTTVAGWLIRDPDAAGPGPLLLDVHSGPRNAWNGAADSVHLYHQELAARGWTVLLLNPRASDGCGEAFHAAAVGGWGAADAADFLEPIDQLVAEGVADPARLAITGYSYGGYMACYLTSRDGRFAAAVPGGAVSDLTGMIGTSDEGNALAAWVFARPSPTADGDALAAMSPPARVADVTTPTLLLHGDADLRCPVGQAEQWHTALRQFGVDVELVRYPGASHLFVLDGKPSHRIDYNHRVVDWVEQYASESKRPKIDGVRWERRLAVLAERHKVPGASLGILRIGSGGRPDEVVEAAYGYANFPAKIEATADTLFQIGSMAKVWTATLAMQLVDEEKLDLDAPVAEVLPELRLADGEVAETVTMRHLLAHTSGIDGDVFTDTGRGDDCLEKYVALLSEQEQNHPLGATWSYCNAGFVLAGRVIEKITGLTWDAALREKIYAPLGMTHTVTLPEEALLFRTAAGHIDVSAEPVLAPVWQLPRSLGPAGLICSTPADVLAFVRMHLTGGLAADGTRVLSAESAAAMTEFQAEVPDKYLLGDSWGIGWIRFGWDGRRLVGHDGNTIGQAAFLRVLPEAGLAVTLLTNGGNTRDLYEDLYREIFTELAGVTMPTPITPPAEPVETDITPHLGSYERAGVLMEILASTDDIAGPTLRTTVTGPLAALTPEPVETYQMHAIGQDLYVVREPEAQSWVPLTFYALASGERYLHFGARATPKVG